MSAKKQPAKKATKQTPKKKAINLGTLVASRLASIRKERRTQEDIREAKRQARERVRKDSCAMAVRLLQSAAKRYPRLKVEVEPEESLVLIVFGVDEGRSTHRIFYYHETSRFEVSTLTGTCVGNAANEEELAKVLTEALVLMADKEGWE